jgi:hypothetical protein
LVSWRSEWKHYGDSSDCTNRLAGTAQETRHRASAERDPAVKKWLEGVAQEYERLAEFTAGRRRNAQENGENT